MSRRIALVSLTVFLVLAMVAVASAVSPNVAGTSKKGSLLVFPKIEAFWDVGHTGYPLVDTYIQIGNDQSAAVSVKCYWMDSNQTIEDFQFTLTGNQPVFFSASQGELVNYSRGNIVIPPFVGVGSLVCFAVTDDGANQLKWNHLYGDALIVTTPPNPVSSVMYNAYSFAVPNAVSGTAGQLDLNGSATAGYDACPQYLLTNFYPVFQISRGFPPPPPGQENRPDLTLWPCKQDLRQDRIPTCTKAKFDVWNGNEVKYTGAYQCLKCFYEGFLDDLGADSSTSKTPTAPPKGYQKGPGFGWEKFLESALGTETARFRVQGIRSSVCDGKTRGCKDTSGNAVNTIDTPLLGLLLYGHWAGALIDPITNYQVVFAASGNTLFGAGAGDQASTGGPGFVKWDIGGSNPEAPAQ